LKRTVNIFVVAKYFATTLTDNKEEI